MIYCEVLLSTSTRGRELKKILVGRKRTSDWSTSTRGRELKSFPARITANTPASTSTRGRELKNQFPGDYFTRECRPPREVVS